VGLTRTLKLSEEVLGVCCSPSGRLLAVALLDSTMKVFFTDTLKVGLKYTMFSCCFSNENTHTWLY